jgi:hypothetical protein
MLCTEESNLESKASDIRKVSPAPPTEILRMVSALSLFTIRRTSAATSGIKTMSVNILLLFTEFIEIQQT